MGGTRLTEAEYRAQISEAISALHLADVNRSHLPDSIEHLRRARDITRDLLPHLNELIAAGYKLPPQVSA
jgi:hypothetical protein